MRIKNTPQFSVFHDLMKYRVRDILLVSTPYDGFVLEEDGRLSERIFNEYQDLNLHYIPKIKQVSSAKEAFEAMKKKTFDLIITMPRISDMNPLVFGKKVKELYPKRPVVMLTYEAISSEVIDEVRKTRHIDKIFHWSGDSKILLALIKYAEDMVNVENDCQLGVQAVLVVDDSPGYYSKFLPLIYTEIMKQSNYLISHAVNDDHRLLRARARPKILLAETYEEAIEIFMQYKNNLLGVISDICFIKDGVETQQAGLILAKQIRNEIHDLPIILQSEESSNRIGAEELAIAFLDKNSSNLMLELRQFIMENYGFGPFQFRKPSGELICDASDIESFEKVIHTLPMDSLLYHSSNNHFSRWFRARTEFEVAEELRQRNVQSFEKEENIRDFILQSLERFFKRYQSGVIIDFGFSKMDIENSFIKLGTGSLGGKGRGIAFFSSLLGKSELSEKYPNVCIQIPRSFIICSDVFEEFMEINQLRKVSLLTDDEKELTQLFLSVPLPSKITANLKQFIAHVKYPLAVRSSSILEDSHILPFAGIYKTFLLPNHHLDDTVRLKQLTDAIKLIYASVFFASPKHYAKNGNLRIEEERMAILIQQLIGEQYDSFFYPTFSGVAQSYNFYPISHMKSEQGIVNLALGFGKTVVEGEQVFRICPSFPKMNPPYSSVDEYLDKSQRSFYALNLKNDALTLSLDEDALYQKLNLSQAETDGVLQYVAGTYSKENDIIVDSLSIQGPRVINFAPIVKHNLLPLSEIIQDLFTMGKHAFGTDVEIEFVVQIPKDKQKPVQFYFLQIRPMVVGKEAQEIHLPDISKHAMILQSSHTIGNGSFDGINDLIYIDPDSFELNQTVNIAREIGQLNRLLFEEKRFCILLGFGRMGTSDPWLGIPLTWSQMSQAKVVIEADRDGLEVEPSLGSHFYHNLTTLRMGYFHIMHQKNEHEYIHWELLKKLPVYKQTKHVKLVRLTSTFDIKIDGRSNRGMITVSKGI